MRFQKGLSLVELMIAITLGLILMTGVIQLFISSKDTFRTQQAVSRVQETGRLAVEFINRDLRMAGFTGFRGRISAISNKIAPVNYANDYVNGVSVIASNAAADIAPMNGTNVLVIRGALAGESSALILPAEAGLLTVTLRSTEVGACSDGATRYNGLCPTDDLMIADYQKTIVFKPTSIAPSGATLQIKYAGGWGGDYLNYKEYFTIGAQISSAQTISYFVREGVSGRPSLFQRINSGAAVELLEGVANIAASYNRFSNPNAYLDAIGTLDGLWNNQSDPVISMQIELLVESIDDRVLDEKQTYRFNNQNISADDFRLRQVFATTVALRNQLP